MVKDAKVNTKKGTAKSVSANSKVVTKKSNPKTTNNSKSKDTSKKKDRKLLIWSVILVCLLILLGISLTYAYFARDFSIEGEEPETVVETGKLDIDFITSEYIKNDDAKLIDDSVAYREADKTQFSVTRSALNTVEYVYYTLQLVDINISDNLKSPYLKWRLYETADITADTKPLNYGDFSDLNCFTNEEGKETCAMDLFDTKIPLAKTVTDDFVLLIWLSNDDSKNQTELLKGNISAKVQVTAVNN